MGETRLKTLELTLTTKCAMTNHFCVLVLFDYPYDMDHESQANT